MSQISILKKIKKRKALRKTIQRNQVLKRREGHQVAQRGLFGE
jgi:hypothetical protein